MHDLADPNKSFGHVGHCVGQLAEELDEYLQGEFHMESEMDELKEVRL